MSKVYVELREYGWILFRVSHPAVRETLLRNEFLLSFLPHQLNRLFFLYYPNRLKFKKNTTEDPYAIVAVDCPWDVIEKIYSKNNIFLIMAVFQGQMCTFLKLQKCSPLVANSTQEPLLPFVESLIIGPPIQPVSQLALEEGP